MSNDILYLHVYGFVGIFIDAKITEVGKKILIKTLVCDNLHIKLFALIDFFFFKTSAGSFTFSVKGYLTS